MDSKKTYIVTCTIILAIALPISLFAQQMSSSNYKISADSLNVGGGNSVSSSYGIEDTVGEVATGDSSSTSYIMHAGYQQMNVSSISISDGADIALSSIGGVTGGTTTGQTVWTVITDDPAGYALSIKAATAPALKSPGGASFADYAPVSGADFNFTVSPSASSFGFSPEGTDIASTYKDNGSTCGSGTTNTADACWNGFATTDKTIAQRTSANSPSGIDTTLKVQAVSGGSHIQDSGTYTANLTVTAVEL